MDHQRSGAVDFIARRHVRARRGGSDDGHGLLARRPPHRPDAAPIGQAPDAALLGDDAGRSDEAAGRGRARRRSTCRSDRPAARRRSITHADRERPVGAEDRVAGEVPAPHAKGRSWCSCGPSQAPSGWRGKLQSFGLRAAALHADRTQQQRTAAVEGFRGGQYHVLVATDVAARGLDIDGITHVVNFEVPDVARNLRAPRRPHRPRRGDRHGADAGRARRAPRARSAAAIVRTGAAGMMRRSSIRFASPHPQPPADADAGGRAARVRRRLVARR